MAEKQKYPIFLPTREILIKITLKFHLTQSEYTRSTRQITIPASKGAEKGEPFLFPVGMSTGMDTIESKGRFF